MYNKYYDYDRCTYADDLDAFYHDDGSHSAGRRKELDRRKYSGSDTYCGDRDDFYGDW